MTRTYLTLLLLLFLGTCVRAQNAASLQLLTKPLGNQIQLRWAPADYPTWSLMRRYGVVVERRKLGPNEAFQPITAERLTAYSLEDFKGLADTNNVHVIAVAEALHGEATPGSREGDMGKVLDLHEEQQQRLFLALINADLSKEAAHCLGWSYTDEGLTSGIPYDYRIRLLAPDTMVVSPTRRLRSTDHYDATAPQNLALKPGDGEVTFTWDAEAENRFTAYHLERSLDGANWERPLDVPMIAKVDDDLFSYNIKVASRTPEYQYRLRGIDPFAWVSPPTAAVTVSLVDRTPPPPPSAIRGQAQENGSNQLQWNYPGGKVEDLQGFQIVRGSSIDGPFTQITKDLLSPRVSNWKDENPLPDQTNYYAVEAVDEQGNRSRGPVNFVRPRDETPPATPLGFTGRIDTLGRVFLLWEPGKEPDLLGYRVYRSHARDREFLQITNEVQHRNFFFDSTTLLVLDETVLYKIVAVDQNYNPSDYSPILELRRPDKIAPAAPSISKYTAKGNTVSLTLRPSESRDVVRQTVWRATGKDSARPIAVLKSTATFFQDTSIAPQMTYSYSVRAEDEVGLFGASAPLVIRTGSVTGRKTVLDLARTQATVPSTFGVQGDDESKEILRWTPPEGIITGFQIYQGHSSTSLRPGLRLSGELSQWALPDPEQYYAIRVIYADGSRSPLSAISEPVKR